VEDVKVVEIATRPFPTSEVRNAVEKEFLRLVQQLPKWGPAYRDGKAVASQEKVAFAAITKLEGKETFEQAKKAQEKRTEVPFTPQKNTTPEGAPIYIAVEQMPEFPGGMAAMMKYLKENIVYPEDAKQANTSGNMVASFVVNAQGKVTDVQVLKKLHPSLDQAFAKSLESLPAWKPGMQNGKAVAVKYTVPFRVVGETTANKDTPPTTSAKDERIFIAVEQMPEFPGGEKAFYSYLSNTVVIPEEVWQAKVEGMAIASFTVSAEGEITKVEVVKKLHPAIDQAFGKALQNMPAWTAGKQNGKAVNVKLNVPFRVVLPK
jgi:TonB family protein